MFHMLHVEYEKKNPIGIYLLHTSRTHRVSKLQAWFSYGQEKSTLHHQHKYDAKTAFVSFREGTFEECLAKMSS